MCAEKKMIEPFEPRQVREGIISYGVSSCGYDMRIADEFRVFTGRHTLLIDPKDFAEQAFVGLKGPTCDIPPNSFCLARSVEYFRIPRNILAICLGKSSYARCGVIVNVTPFEPEWEGYVTMSISNTAPAPARIYADEGIAQVIFIESDGPCETSYADRKGKYQKQTGISLTKL